MKIVAASEILGHWSGWGVDNVNHVFLVSPLELLASIDPCDLAGSVFSPILNWAGQATCATLSALCLSDSMNDHLDADALNRHAGSREGDLRGEVLPS